jgi:hypothetical protein
MKTRLSIAFLLFTCLATATEDRSWDFSAKKIGVPPLGLREAVRMEPLNFWSEAKAWFRQAAPRAPTPRSKLVSHMPVLIPRAERRYHMPVKTPDSSIDHKMIVKAPDIELTNVIPR